MKIWLILLTTFCAHKVTSVIFGLSLSTLKKFPENIQQRIPIGTNHSFHSKGPIGFGPENAVTFAINKLKNPSCQLTTGFVTTYRVMKMRSHDRSSLRFYAIHGTNHFTLNPAAGEDPAQSQIDDYIGQIAGAFCRHGHIDLIKVSKKRNHNARRCGIATVLTELCLLDPEVYELGEGNSAYRVLQKHQRESNCKQVVGMQMGANPLKGAHAYFTAAINTGFQKLIVVWWSFQRIAIYDTVIAKQNYDGNKGVIEPCCNNEFRCLAQDAHWIFCKEI